MAQQDRRDYRYGSIGSDSENLPEADIDLVMVGQSGVKYGRTFMTGSVPTM